VLLQHEPLHFHAPILLRVGAHRFLPSAPDDVHARGVHARARELSVELVAEAPLGIFLDVSASVENGGHDGFGAVATLSDGERVVASARGSFALLE